MEVCTDINIGAQGPEFPPTTKCEFCDVTFKCDLDVSRHLTSDIHTRNRNSFASNYSQKENNRTSGKEVPKNINQVLQLLKIKGVKDLDHLADRGYFKISNETHASLGSEVSRYLLKAFIQHATKDLPPEIRQDLTQAANAADDNEKSTNKTIEPPAPTPSLPQPATAAPSSKHVVPAGPSRQSIDPKLASKKTATPTKNPPPIKQTPVASRPPLPKQSPVPGPTTKSKQTPPPTKQTPVAPRPPLPKQSPVPGPTTKSKQTPPPTKQTPVAPRPPLPKQSPVPGPTTKSKQNPPPAERTRPVLSHIPHPVFKPRPAPAPKSVQASKQDQVQRPGPGATMRQLPTPRPVTTQAPTPVRFEAQPRPAVLLNLPATSAAPKPTTSVASKPPTQQQQQISRRPQPNKDSTYKPQLAIIKIEPKDQ